MLPIFALSLAVVFFVLLRQGILDQLPEWLRSGLQRRTPPRIAKDTEEERRLEVFKDFFEGDSKPKE
ncbi:MAG TPA: hypothetical protein VI729_01840 [Anaerolineales bacterium]|nr:hypothetical protein [Anaerolineales bacterium]